MSKIVIKFTDKKEKSIDVPEEVDTIIFKDDEGDIISFTDSLESAPKYNCLSREITSPVVLLVTKSMISIDIIKEEEDLEPPSIPGYVPEPGDYILIRIVNDNIRYTCVGRFLGFSYGGKAIILDKYIGPTRESKNKPILLNCNYSIWLDEIVGISAAPTYHIAMLRLSYPDL